MSDETSLRNEVVPAADGSATLPEWARGTMVHPASFRRGAALERARYSSPFAVVARPTIADAARRLSRRARPWGRRSGSIRVRTAEPFNPQGWSLLLDAYVCYEVCSRIWGQTPSESTAAPERPFLKGGRT
jgi:hypothetical protein